METMRWLNQIIGPRSLSFSRVPLPFRLSLSFADINTLLHLDDRPTGPIFPLLTWQISIVKPRRFALAILGMLFLPSFWIATERLDPGDRKPYP